MAIQVWNGSEYVGAELGRFGEGGTLKEALVWDSAAGEYVKVWPVSTGPYPMGDQWSGSLASGPVFLLDYTPTADATIRIQATITGNFGPQGFVMAMGGDGDSWSHYGTAVSGSGTTTLDATQSVIAGERIRLAIFPQMGGGGAASGSWSVTEV